MAFNSKQNVPTVPEPPNMHEYIVSLIGDKDLQDKVPANTTLALVRNRYCSKCNAEEFAQYILFCVTYDLNPLMGLVECVKYSESSPAQIFLGKDGLLAVAYKTGKLESIKTGIYYANPNVIVAKNLKGDVDCEDTYSVVKIPGKEKPPEMHAWCRVKRKGLVDPIEVDIKTSEYHKYNDVWSSKTETMSKKVALSQALSMAFPAELSGIYIREEMEYEDSSILDKTDPRETLAKILNEGVTVQPEGLKTSNTQTPKIINPDDFLSPGYNVNEVREHETPTVEVTAEDIVNDVTESATLAAAEVAAQRIVKSETVDSNDEPQKKVSLF